ncbi:MAG TPA: phosphotransferase family protein [Caulobacteraceae bacterium]|nr:phosphotransferase family protein [Caulobacteraceae bacterium]
MGDLEQNLIDWIAVSTGGEVTEARLATVSGRAGYRIDVRRDGEPLALFLQRGRKPSESSFLPLAREAEVSRAVEAIGVKVPHVWAVSESENVVLSDRVAGVVWFVEPADVCQQVYIAQDYIRQLATWHSTPAAALDLPSFQPIRGARRHQRDQLAGIRKLFEEADRASPIDAIARVSLSYLERNIPDYNGPAVLCQGDTGPGNFLYRGDEVVAVVDWELAHVGDPMDDIAWLSWRATQHGFPDFPERLREYERLSGFAVDPERVRYYRVNACARLGPWFGLADMGEAGARRRERGDDSPSADDRDSDGSQMVMTMLHRRMRLTALADALGVTLPSRFLAEEAPVPEHARRYDRVLTQLQTLATLVADPNAARQVKGIARQVKYLKGANRNHARFERQELADISRLLGRTPGSLDEGRPALAEATREGKVSFEGYLLYHWNRVVRDDHMMREASGRLFDRTWPELA